MNNKVYVVVVFGDLVEFNEDVMGAIASEAIFLLKKSFPWIIASYEEQMTMFKPNVDDKYLHIISDRIYKAIESIADKLNSSYIVDITFKENYFIIEFIENTG